MQKKLFDECPQKAKPFLKWAGGKTQLLNELSSRLPKKIIESRIIKRYVEPFVGSGALFFQLKNEFKINKSYIFDINRELIIGWKVIQNNHSDLINNLYDLQKSYLRKPEEERKKIYYKIRTLYNEQMHNFDYSQYNKDWIERATHLIFLNKTCFNGLFRQNTKGEFNVPFGRYKKPKICNEKDIKAASYALNDTEIFCNDFSRSARYINEKSFVYFDPPYRPISKTSYFTAYSKNVFGDIEQEKLAEFFKKMHKKGAFLMLSNSDPKNEDPSDVFFDDLYKDFYIERVKAMRFINCDASKRGAIKELIIRNYKK